MCAGWSFRFTSIRPSRRVACPGETIDMAFGVFNDGLRLGSVYITLRVVCPYDANMVVFDSDRSLAFTDRQAWRLIDVATAHEATFFASWRVPSTSPPGAYYFQAGIWNTPTVMRPRKPGLRYRNHCFALTGSIPGVEVVDLLNKRGASPTERPLKALISYSWDSDSHQEWVLSLADELAKHGIHVIMDRRDLLAGEEITHFMERSIEAADVLILVCTSNYVKKANERLGGVGMETVISSSIFLQSRTSKSFIPIVRDNTNPGPTRLPTYLGSTLYIDMSAPYWRAQTVQ